MNEKIINAMAELDEDVLYTEVDAAIAAGTPVADIIDDLQKGMTIVGDRFASREYFLSELMLSAVMFRECQEKMGGAAVGEAKYGNFVIGTVAGDVHDIGKNIVASVMASNGFNVIDLGVDVPAEKFVQAIKEYQPKVIGLSCLLTTVFGAMKDAIAQIRDAGLAEGRLILIGGGPVEQSTVEYVNADAMCRTAQETVNRAIEFVTK